MEYFKLKLKNPITWIGLILLSLSVWSFVWSFDEGGILNQRYFTNQTIFLTVLTMVIWLSPQNNKSWFSYLASLTLVNLVLTGLTFHFILDIERPITLQGHLAHTIIPLFYLGFYLFLMPGYHVSRFYRLLVYPIVYLLTFLITGPVTGFYPYWFLDIETQGFWGVINFTMGLMLPGFSVLAVVLLTLKQRLNQRQTVSQK